MGSTNDARSDRCRFKDFQCGYENSNAFEPRTAERPGLNFSEAHSDASAMALRASEVRKESRSRVCSLPFCCTIEAEALGARINMGNTQNGPRIGEYVFNSLEALPDGLGVLDFSRGRIHEVLAACRLLKARGEYVSVGVSGPMTILNGLMDITRVFREWRKNEPLMQEVLNRLGREIFKYVVELKAAGADILNFADPTGTPGILGPKYSGMLAECFLTSFLKKTEPLLDESSVMQICPRTSHLLTALGLAEWRSVELGRPMPYDEGCLACRGKVKFLGQSCIKNKKFFLQSGKIQELYLV
jgi:uroporphyrinogen-III decarboxylase